MSKRKTTEQFINEAQIVHNRYYKYNETNYINANSKVIITCPVHGNFTQQPCNHLQGKGCRECANVSLREERKFSKEQIISRCKEVHSTKYTYDLKDYKNLHTKITITCLQHGPFKQTLNSHINQEQGCPSCGKISKRVNSLMPLQEFINRSIMTHANKYDYSQVNYKGWEDKVTIICPKHGLFKQAPRDHLDGCGCQMCAKHGFDPNSSAYLYYLKVTTNDGQILYKIGITNRTVNERFQLTDLSKIEIIKQKLYENGQDAWDWELKFKQKYKQYQYKGPDVLSSGNTELFIEDIYKKFIEESQ